MTVLLLHYCNSLLRIDWFYRVNIPFNLMFRRTAFGIDIQYPFHYPFKINDLILKSYRIISCVKWIIENGTLSQSFRYFVYAFSFINRLMAKTPNHMYSFFFGKFQQNHSSSSISLRQRCLHALVYSHTKYHTLENRVYAIPKIEFTSEGL